MTAILKTTVSLIKINVSRPLTPMDNALSSTNNPHAYRILELDSEITPLHREVAGKGPLQLAKKASLALDIAHRCLIKPFTYKLHSLTLTGDARFSDASLCVKYVGDGSQFHYLRSLCFSNEVQESPPLALSLWTLQQAFECDDKIDILIVDLPMPLNLFSRMPGRVTPHWLKQRIDLPPSWPDFLSALRRKTRMEAQRIIRKFELKARIVPGPEFASEFYTTLYKPYTLARHGDASVVEEHDAFIRDAKDSSFVQLTRDNQVLAASQVRQSGSSFSIPYVGMDLTLPEKEQFCLVDAMDYFALMYAIELGCESVDMGHSRANLSDGILRYKKKWGADANAGVIPKGSLSFLAKNTRQVVKDFYAANPLVSKAESQQLLAFKLIKEQDKLSSLESQLKQLAMSGLTELQIICPELRRAEFETLNNNGCRIISYRDDNQLLDLINDTKG